jgi:glycosyltransferase involved in cell wall biosynthesis
MNSPLDTADDLDVLLVLGTHRSGTSMTTDGLSRLGGHLSASLIGASESNPAGHFEDAEIVELTKAIEAKIKRPHFDVRGVLPAAGVLGRADLSEEKRVLEAIILRNIQGSPAPWIVKDPRTQRLLRLWTEILDAHGLRHAAVTCLRNPSAVCHSRAKRNNIHFNVAQFLWMTEMAELIVNTGGDPGQLIEFERLVESPLDCLAAASAGMPPSMRHDGTDLAERVSGLVDPNLVHFAWERDAQLLAETQDFYDDLRALGAAETEERRESLRARLLKVAESHLQKMDSLSSFVVDKEWLLDRLIDKDRQMIRAQRQLRNKKAATPPQPEQSAADKAPHADAPHGGLYRTGPYHADAETAVFPNLQVPRCDAPPRPLDVCIVTQDIYGPIKNGGIGTAYRYVADLLAGAGHNVTILYALGEHCENGTIQDWIDHYAERNITFVPLPQLDLPSSSGILGQVTALARRSYEWLLTQSFDVVHVSEWRGTGYYALLAKNLGLAFADTTFVVKCSSPTLWNKLGGMTTYDKGLRDAALSFMEKRSVELADTIVSGSLHLLRWMLGKGYDIPRARTYMQPNIMLTSTLPPAETTREPGTRVHIDEIVFFGRLEPRKGLFIFCNAIDNLFKSTERKPKKVSFLGKPAKVVDGEAIIRRHAEKWGCEVEILTDRNQSQALKYLGGEGRLAVIPSLLENSSFAIYECLIYKIPFVASNRGGNAELIHKDSHKDAVFAIEHSDLARCLKHVMRNGAVVPKPSFDYEENNRTWLDWHAQLLDADTKARHSAAPPQRFAQLAPKDYPLVSVCIAHYERPDFIDNAILSVKAQTYPNIEVILVDDGSESATAKAKLDEIEREFATRGWQLVRKQNEYLGASRNTAAAHATGRYLLFMDDDNMAKSHEVERFVQVALDAGKDVLTCFSDTFANEDNTYPPTPIARITPLGPDPAFGMFRNGFGDSNCFVSRAAFDALGGFTEHYRVGRDDQEFFARAVLRGYRLEVLPEPLFWYRKNPVEQSMKSTNVSVSAGQMRVLETYIDNAPAAFSNVFMLGLAFFNQLDEARADLKEKSRIAGNRIRWHNESLQPDPAANGARMRLGLDPLEGLMGAAIPAPGEADVDLTVVVDGEEIDRIPMQRRGGVVFAAWPIPRRLEPRARETRFVKLLAGTEDDRMERVIKLTGVKGAYTRIFSKKGIEAWPGGEPPAPPAPGVSPARPAPSLARRGVRKLRRILSRTG